MFFKRDTNSPSIKSVTVPTPRPPREHVTIFTYGSKDAYDPDHLLATLSSDTVLDQIVHIRGQLDIPKDGGEELFHEWDRSFIRSIWSTAVTSMELTNGARHGLSGKQLVMLQKFWRRLTRTAKEEFPR